tara:strand:+ start:2060 stop:2230 length:171 start_codon:yes stop_codon:yes gene_type:complete
LEVLVAEIVEGGDHRPLPVKKLHIRPKHSVKGEEIGFLFGKVTHLTRINTSEVDHG